jgi:hypothetical protein
MQPGPISIEVRLHPVAEQRRRRGSRAAPASPDETSSSNRVVLVTTEICSSSRAMRTRRFAHLRDFGQGADREALQADLRGESQRRIDDGSLGLLALLQDSACARSGLGLEGHFGDGHGISAIKTNDRSILHESPGRERLWPLLNAAF